MAFRTSFWGLGDKSKLDIVQTMQAIHELASPMYQRTFETFDRFEGIDEVICAAIEPACREALGHRFMGAITGADHIFILPDRYNENALALSVDFRVPYRCVFDIMEDAATHNRVRGGEGTISLREFGRHATPGALEQVHEPDLDSGCRAYVRRADCRLMELAPQDLIEAYAGRAGLLARCILYGLVEPMVQITPAVLATLSQAIVEELLATPKAQFLTRMPRALKWAVRPDVSPELAIFTIEQVLGARSPLQRRLIAKTDEYGAYREKLGALLDDAVA